MVVSRTESQTNEWILTEELDIVRSELRELHTNNSKLLSQAEYNEERFNILSANTGIYCLHVHLPKFVFCFFFLFFNCLL
jgi:hypothetical protein